MERRSLKKWSPQNGPLENKSPNKKSLENCFFEKRSPKKWSPEKKVPGEMVPGKKVPGEMVPGKWSPENKSPNKKSPQNGPFEKKSPKKWSLGKWSLEKCPRKIVLRQKNARKFDRLFYFYRLIPVDALNCRTLKESRKVYCRVLGFHRLIRSQHS